MTCLVCMGSGKALCSGWCPGFRAIGVGPIPHTHPCTACRGAGSNPLRDVTSDDVDATIDALEADRSRLRAEIEAITVQRDWAMASRDEALERLDWIRRGWPALVRHGPSFFSTATTESKASRPGVRGLIGEET